MNKLYQKNELNFSLVLIGIYIVLYSIMESISKIIGIEKLITFIFCLIYSIWIYNFINNNDLKEKYGLIKPNISLKKVLYYIPLLIIVTANIWFGIKINFSFIEAIFYILTMFCVGFLEEIIVRGFIFKALEKDNLKKAIIISSIAFGLSHIINLFNGSGIKLLANILQVFYATGIGFLFVILFYKTKSSIPSIISHGIFNALSAFANVEAFTVEVQIISAIILIIISFSYSYYLIKN